MTITRLIDSSLVIFGVCCILAPAQTVSHPERAWLPLRVGLKWVLRNPSEKNPVIFEVIRQEGEVFVFRSSTPWSVSEWGLLESDGQYLMTSYGTGGPMMPLKNRPMYLDFGRQDGGKWQNPLGTMTLASKRVTVQAKSSTYQDCIQIRHTAGNTNLTFTFARGVGYVQFGEGRHSFVLDEASSVVIEPSKLSVPSGAGLRDRHLPN